MNKKLPWILIAVGIGVAFFAAQWSALRFAELKAADIPARFSALFLFALLIERTVEVLLTIWRAEESNKLEAEVQHLLSPDANPTETQVKNAKTALIEYRATTQRWALPISFTLGLIIASIGVRAVDQFIDPAMPTHPSDTQLWWFHVADTVLTAALLAGGADPIHKVMDTFRKFMEASSARASGTTK